MNNKRRIVLCSLAVIVALASPSYAQEAGPAPNPGGVGEKQNSVGAMREWLAQRNLERKKLGLPGADMPKTHAALKSHSDFKSQYAFKSHAATARHRLRPEHKSAEASVPDYQPEPPRGTPVLHIGQGPDGRIHHRWIMKEEGPDQLQVYTPSGYAAAPPAEDDAKLARLTPRGKRAWMAGASSRLPESRWLKPSLDPKARDDEQ